MATKQARGTKRTCQNDDCGSRFYDLGHDPIVCPVCEAVYKLASAPLSVVPVAEEKPRVKAKKPEFVADKAAVPAGAEAAEGEEVIEDIEAGEEIAAEEDETFLEEEEEEGGDLSNVIGGPVVEGEEEV